MPPSRYAVPDVDPGRPVLTQTIPWSRAHIAALVRSATPILRKIFARWVFTVRSLMPRARAICLFASPRRRGEDLPFPQAQAVDPPFGDGGAAAAGALSRGSVEPPGSNARAIRGSIGA